MATYDFSSTARYDDADGSQSATSNTAGSLLDDGGDGYTVGEQISTVGANAVNYAGTVEIDGVIYPVGVVATGALAGDLIVFGHNDITGTAPANLVAGDLNTADFTPCFAAGTEIATADGVALVEDLKIGDMIRTFDGRDVAVKWVGRKVVSTKFRPAERLQPVKVTAGALGEALPSKDLTVTADHALLIGDTLCAAGALVNGTTITRTAELGETYSVYHVETEAHEVILANGVAAETFIDKVARTAFDNYGEFEALYGDVAEMKELDYPRAMTARQVPAAIKAALASEKVA